MLSVGISILLMLKFVQRKCEEPRLTVSFAIEFPRGIPHDVEAPLDVDLLNIGLGARTFR